MTKTKNIQHLHFEGGRERGKGEMEELTQFTPTPVGPNLVEKWIEIKMKNKQIIQKHWNEEILKKPEGISRGKKSQGENRHSHHSKWAALI